MQKTVLQTRIEELILITIILLNLFSIFGILPVEGEYIIIIITWSALGYLLYKISLSDLFFGHKHKHIDLILIISYFLLILKNFVEFSRESINESDYLYSLFSYILENAQVFETVSFYIGCISLMFLSFYITYYIDIKKPSILHMLHGHEKQDFSLRSVLRVISVFFVVMGFFIVVFNLLFEWISVVIDAPLVLIAVLFYIFKFHGYSKTLDTESVIYKIADFGEGFYRRFVNLFHNRQTIFLGIGGMLVLHLLTDLANFIIPYVLGFSKTLYFSKIGESRSTIFFLLLNDMSSAQLISEKIFLISGYLFNIVAIVILMTFPSFIWYVMYDVKTRKVSNFLISLFFSSLVFFILNPIFKITQLNAENLIGVDIKLYSILQNSFSLRTTAIISLVVLFSLSLLLKAGQIKKLFFVIMTLLSLTFFGYYIYNYFINLALFYISAIRALFIQNSFFLMFYMCVFLLISVLFYVGGYFVFVVMVFKNK
ncbi:hypothetical protein JXB41_01120 [Candidatus Woesearchaeota archaeon]|nr:hypothetical protein [Candidatus Woesearchaeota archaeon]